MKKLLLPLLLLTCISTSYAAIQSVSCGSMWSGAGTCGSCFQETQKIYTCNPYQTSCQKQAVSGLNDVATNVSGTDKVMYQFYMGSYSAGRLQSTTSWTMSHSSFQDMFEIPQEYLQPAASAGQKWYQYFSSSGRYWHLLPVGTSVKWTQMKSGAWIRPDIASEWTNGNSPAYKVTFTPRLYTNSTNYIDHSQCVFYSVRFCGDGVIDTDRGEQCDDGNMNSGDGCSNICQTEVTPVCTNLSVTPTATENGGTITYTCTGTNATSYSLVVKNSSGTTIETRSSATGTFTIPASPAATYTASCYINGQTTTPAACTKTITNTISTVTPQIDIDKRDNNSADLDGTVGNDTQTVTSGTPAVFKIRVTNNGTEDLRNLVLTDTLAPNCAGSVTLPSTYPNTWSSFSQGGSGSHTDNILQVGEWFEYTCDRSNTTSPYTNSATVTATGVTSGTSVTDTDTTPVLIPTTPTTPQIDVDKRDNNPADLDGTIGNDTQTVNIGNSAVFKIRVTNNGTEDLQNLFLTDNMAPSCGGSVTLPSTYPNTWSSFSQGGSGSHTDNILQVGEWFEYTCDRGNTTTGYTNSVTVNGTGVTSGTPVTDTDTTPVLVPSNPVNPQIEVIKDDNDNRDDTQFVSPNGVATFSILVRNNGNESLQNIVLTDPRAPECNRTASQTQSMILATGNGDYKLDPGESFSYICSKGNVQPDTFPNGENQICVNGNGIISGGSVNDCDISRVTTGSPEVCQYINVNQNGGNTQVNCGPGGGYSLYVLNGQQVANTFKNTNGQFNFNLNPGNYKLVCVKDGETEAQPNCQRKITVSGSNDYCRLDSSVRYGGLPLRTNLNCQSNSYEQCVIRITKNGQPWRSISDCRASIVFNERGVYDATCVIGGRVQDSCNTQIQADVMTDVPTGPMTPLMIIAAIATGGYIFYRRRKTV